jgi:hypothetical protein
MKLFQLFLLITTFAVSLSVFSGVFFSLWHYSQDVSALNEKIDRLGSTIRDLKVALSESECFAMLAFEKSVCRHPKTAHENDAVGCCEPRLVNLTAASQSITNNDKFWNQHTHSIRGRKFSFWIDTHDFELEDKYVSASIHAGVPWEQEIVDLFSRCLLEGPSNQLVLDVGASHAYYHLNIHSRHISDHGFIIIPPLA